MKTILISTSSFGEVDETPLKLLRKAFNVIENPYKKKLTKEQLVPLLDGVSGLLAGVETLDCNVLEQQSCLKVISRCGSGLTNIDLKAAKSLGIEVHSTPEAPVDSVAEMTIAGILTVLKNIPAMNSDLHNGIWKKRIGRELKGTTALVVGYGRIGKRVCQILDVFGVAILISDPMLKKSKYEIVDLYDGLCRADLVILHANTSECLLDSNALKCCDGSFIFNAARGVLVDEDALIDSIKAKRVLGAWIDVFEEEPYSGDLVNYPEVILSPHASTYTLECRKTMELQSACNLIGALV